MAYDGDAIRWGLFGAMGVFGTMTIVIGMASQEAGSSKWGYIAFVSLLSLLTLKRLIDVLQDIFVVDNKRGRVHVVECGENGKVCDVRSLLPWEAYSD
jgi:hypothetical protein